MDEIALAFENVRKLALWNTGELMTARTQKTDDALDASAGQAR
jgi:hypothetical protein